MGFGIKDCKIIMIRIKKTMIRNILFSIIFISTITSALTISELLTPTDKVMNKKYVENLYSNNLDNRDSIILSCSGREASSFTMPKYQEDPEESDATIFTDGFIDWNKLSNKLGKKVSFIISIDNKGIAIIEGLPLEDPNASLTDDMHYKDFLIFMNKSENYPWVEFSTVKKRMKYGRQFKGSINRYTGDINISLDTLRSKSKDNYLLRATCNQVKKLF